MVIRRAFQLRPCVHDGAAVAEGAVGIIRAIDRAVGRVKTRGQDSNSRAETDSLGGTLVGQHRPRGRFGVPPITVQVVLRQNHFSIARHGRTGCLSSAGLSPVALICDALPEQVVFPWLVRFDVMYLATDVTVADGSWGLCLMRLAVLFGGFLGHPFVPETHSVGKFIVQFQCHFIFSSRCHRSARKGPYVSKQFP